MMIRLLISVLAVTATKVELRRKDERFDKETAREYSVDSCAEVAGNSNNQKLRNNSDYDAMMIKLLSSTTCCSCVVA